MLSRRKAKGRNGGDADVLPAAEKRPHSTSEDSARTKADKSEKPPAKRGKGKAGEDEEEGEGETFGCRRFTLGELVAATNTFGTVLGLSDSGPVFEGALPCGTKIAVKCLQVPDRRKALDTEVHSLRSYQHQNIIQLLGVCVTKDKTCIVYPLMAKKSLKDVLSESKCTLTWKQRVCILHDIVLVLAYLQHTQVHATLRLDNILLSEHFEVRLGPLCLTFHSDDSMKKDHDSDVKDLGLIALQLLLGRAQKKDDKATQAILTLLKNVEANKDKLILQMTTDGDPIPRERLVELLELTGQCVHAAESVRLDAMAQRIQCVLDCIASVVPATDGGSAAVPNGSGSSRPVCVICMDDEATFAMVPCGHECVCAEDAKIYQGRESRAVHGSCCPVCRARITNIIRVFT